MSTLTIRLPDAKHERLKAFARTRGVSVNKLVEELATVALAQADAENRFLLRKARGKPAVGLPVISHAALTGIPAAAATCGARRLLSGSESFCGGFLSSMESES